jgi:hypothetical protein
MISLLQVKYFPSYNAFNNIIITNKDIKSSERNEECKKKEKTGKLLKHLMHYHDLACAFSTADKKKRLKKNNKDKTVYICKAFNTLI